MKYIITKEELSKDNWFTDLQLSQASASDEEYKKLVAILVGSHYVSYQSQSIDYQEDTRDTNRRPLDF